MKIIFAHKLFSGLLIACFIFAFLGPKPESASAVSTSVVISQVYGGGGNSGATYNYDFVEIFNRGTTTVNLTGWSIQYASATGSGNFGANTGQLTPLAGSIGPGQYILIQEATNNVSIGATLPIPDITDTTAINIAGNNGKVALVNSTISLGCNGGSNPCNASQLALIIDLVGFGSANFFESAAVPTLTNTTAALRKNNGCTETDNNAADFTTGAPAPRNSSSPLNVCAVDYAPEVSSTTPPDGYLNFQVSNDLEVTFNEPVDVTDGWFTLSCSPSGVHTATWSGGPTTFTINPVVDFTDADECTLTINAAQVSDQDTNDYPDKMAANEVITFTAIDNCAATTTPIGAIQGTGGTSPLEGSTVTTRGIVVGDFEGPSPALRGFNIQDTGDADPLTSNGIFIYNNNDNNNVSIGDEVVVSGVV
ncbi:MAG TPA: lamin tail domain-containing protein [Anaerolineaceae bacterium]|nr:lamin tail domain-containing protein [Anaerolineaceae bacterium]